MFYMRWFLNYIAKNQYDFDCTAYITPVELELDADLELDDFSNNRYCSYIDDIST